MRSEIVAVTDGPRAASDTCPRCGSAEVRRLSLIHQAGLTASEKNGAGRMQTVLSKNAAPPAMKPRLSWAVLAIASFVVVVVSLPGETPKTLVPLAVAAFAMAKWLRAVWYNNMVYPGLYSLWEKSFMCGRCGEVFAD
jgi:predicted RNA-binding Zn-ribbon protein involved in translation (DUF1610 family)